MISGQPIGAIYFGALSTCRVPASSVTWQGNNNANDSNVAVFVIKARVTILKRKLDISMTEVSVI